MCFLFLQQRVRKVGTISSLNVRDNTPVKLFGPSFLYGTISDSSNLCNSYRII